MNSKIDPFARDMTHSYATPEEIEELKRLSADIAELMRQENAAKTKAERIEIRKKLIPMIFEINARSDNQTRLDKMIKDHFGEDVVVEERD